MFRCLAIEKITKHITHLFVNIWDYFIEKSYFGILIYIAELTGTSYTVDELVQGSKRLQYYSDQCALC